MKWLEYKGPNSLPEGPYRWKIGNLSFIAMNRIRGAGFESVTSPRFDHWNGYNVLTPKGLLYQNVERDASVIKESDYKCIAVEGLEPAPCPFCKKVPELEFLGRFIGAGPHQAERWWLNCCAMIFGKGFATSKPEQVINFWNKKNDGLSN